MLNNSDNMDFKIAGDNCPLNRDQCHEDNNIPKYTSMVDFTKDGFKTLMESIRHANNLPAKRDFDFYYAQESFQKIINSEGNNILSLINNILKNNGIRDNIKSSILDHKTELLIEANDSILENVANNIDEMSGIKKNSVAPIELQTVTGNLPINGSWNNPKKAKFVVDRTSSINESETSKDSIRLLTAKNIVRPQTFFRDKVDNSNLYPWEPKIKDKPNSLKPLAIFLEETERGEEFSHPYEFELDNFSPPKEQLIVDNKEPVYPKSLADTNFIEVSTPDSLLSLVEDLRNHKIIAVDLEHHSYRTFMGITCLMQISTIDTDYIVDTLILRDSLHILNEIFTKPSVIKIFHGADSDILWLQRDLCLYVVNMFDTHQAAKLLNYSSLSLASLLERFCKFTPNKHFQLADWRMRPLPDVLKEYAREDTHYLIYIYHILKAELLKKAGGDDKFLLTVYQRSTDICKRRFFKQRWTEESHLDFYRMCKRMFDNRQMYALKELYKWRDQTARNEDESTSYVLPNHMLLQISETLPREMQGIIACCNPVPPLVRSNLLEIHQMILRAREKPLDQPILQEDTRARGSTLQLLKLNVDSPLYCPHDLTRNGDFRDDLPVLLNDKKSINLLVEKKFNIEALTCALKIFHHEKNEYSQKCTTKKRFLAPFERYKLVKPFIKEEEKKNEVEKMDQNKKDNTDVKPCIGEVKSNSFKISETIEIEDEIDKINRNLNNLIQEDRTEEERIASIREHFTMLSKKTQEDEEFAKRKEEQLYQKAATIVNQQAQSLVQMGGTKKRKREQIDEDQLQVENSNLEHRFLNPAPYSTKDEYLHLGHKRKKTESTGVEDKETYAKGQNLGYKSRGRQKTIQHKGRVDKCRIEKRGDRGGAGSSHGYNKFSSNKQGAAKLPNKKQKNKKEADDSFESFDYSSVDFRQFQGGGRSVNQGKSIKTNFKNKGKKKNMNKAFNKSSISKNPGKKR